MANQFVAIPAPAANGSGAAVDVSTFGALKTVTVVKNGAVFTPFVTIECSNEDAPTHWFEVGTLQSDELTFENAAHWMRATVSNYKGGGAPTVELGGTDDGSTFAELAVPVGNGVGAGTDVSALGLFKTVQVGGPFGGALNIEISEDAGATYSTAFSFSSLPGAQSGIFAADFMRVSRNGVPLVAPGLPDVWVGAANPVGGGGGGGMTILENESDIGGNPHTIMNVMSPLVATDDGGGQFSLSLPFANLGIQSFRYVASGAETTAGFPITLQTPRGDANYNAIVTLLDTNEDYTVEQPPGGYTNLQFTCFPGANLTVGDILAITIIPLT